MVEVQLAGRVRFLHALMSSDPASLAQWVATGPVDSDWLRWLLAHGFVPYTFYRLQMAGLIKDLPREVYENLRGIYLKTIVHAELRRREVALVLDALSAVGICPVLLKGAALAEVVYPDWACRPMGDLDLWLTDEEMPRAQDALAQIGYEQIEKATRPVALQARYEGEIQMTSQRPGCGLVELHWSPFVGEWLHRTARVDGAAIRKRLVPITAAGRQAYILAPEDGIIHLAVHLAINHQMAFPWGRGMLDVVMAARAQEVCWEDVVARAQAWRLGTAVWVVLCLASDLLGLSEAEGAIARLRPSSLRRWLLSGLANSQSFLEMRDLTRGPLRFVFQMLLVDRPQDALRLLGRALWPEEDWLAARYGRAGGSVRMRHLWGAVRGQI